MKKLHLSQFNARGPRNNVEYWFDLIHDELEKQEHEVRQFWLRGTQPKKEDIEWMDFAIYHFSQVALYYRRIGVPFCIMPSANDCFPDNGAKLKIAASHKNCRFVTYQSMYHLKKYKEWDIPKPKVYVPHPVRTELFKRDKFRYDRILAGGRLIPKKGLDKIVGKVAGLTVFGDGPLRKDLEEGAFRWSKTKATEFTGWLDGQQLKNLMEESWLFLNPSVVTSDGDSDGVPNTIKEAMLMKMHVISTPVAGIPELENITLLSDWSNIWKVIQDMPRQWNWKGDKEIRSIYTPKFCVNRLLEGIEEYGKIKEI